MITEINEPSRVGEKIVLQPHLRARKPHDNARHKDKPPIVAPPTELRIEKRDVKTAELEEAREKLERERENPRARSVEAFDPNNHALLVKLYTRLSRADSSLTPRDFYNKLRRGIYLTSRLSPDLVRTALSAERVMTAFPNWNLMTEAQKQTALETLYNMGDISFRSHGISPRAGVFMDILLTVSGTRQPEKTQAVVNQLTNESNLEILVRSFELLSKSEEQQSEQRIEASAQKLELSRAAVRERLVEKKRAEKRYEENRIEALREIARDLIAAMLASESSQVDALALAA